MRTALGRASRARRVARAPASVPRFGEIDFAVAGAAVLVALLLAVFVLWPLLRIVAVSLGAPGSITLAGFRAFFASARLLRILGGTLLVAAVSTILTVIIALVLAYAVTRTSVPGKRFVSSMSLLPLLSPPFLVSLALILLFGRNGVVPHALHLEWSIDGFSGIVAAQVVSFLPQAYLRLADALGSIDTRLEEAAENLGAGTLTILRRITLALARRGLASAALVVFVLCLTDFGNPILVGGRYPVLATEIYAQVIGRNDLAAAAVTSVVLLIPCALAYLAFVSIVGRRAYATVPADRRRSLRPTAPALRWSLFAFTALAAAAIALLYALIPLGSFVRLWGADWSLSSRHYTFAWTAEGTWPAWNSAKLALVAGAAGTVLALLAAYVIERGRPPGARALEFTGLLPAALPGTVVGVGYVLAFSAPPLWLTGTFVLVVASVVFSSLPVALLAGLGTLAQVGPAVEETAISLGASTPRMFARVVLPMLAGTASSIFVHFFLTGLGTVSAVIFLLHPGFNVGSVAIVGHVATGDPGVACALGTMVLAIALGALVLLRVLVGRDRLVILQ